MKSWAVIAALVTALLGACTSTPRPSDSETIQLRQPLQERVGVIVDFLPGTIKEGDLVGDGEPYLFVYHKAYPEQRVVVPIKGDQTTYSVPLPAHEPGDEFVFEMFDEDGLQEKDVQEIANLTNSSQTLVAIAAASVSPAAGALTLGAVKPGEKLARAICHFNMSGWDFICGCTYRVPDAGIPTLPYTTPITLHSAGGVRKGDVRVYRK